MGGVSLLSQTNLETHDQIWSSFLNQDAIAEASEVDYSESVCDDLSLNSEELYEEVLSPDSSDNDVYNSSVDSVFPPSNDSFLELENDFTDLLRYEYRNDYILEVQPSSERKRSISHVDIQSTKKPKVENSSTTTTTTTTVNKVTEQSKEEDDFIIESDEEETRNGNTQTTEVKLTKMISQLDPLHLQKAIEIMSDSQILQPGEMRFDLSKMNQSKLLKLYDFVSKCHSNEIIDLDDDFWSTSPSSSSSPSPISIHKQNDKKVLLRDETSPISSPYPTRPNTPSPLSTPGTPSNRLQSPTPTKVVPSVFSQNKALEERLKGIVKPDNKKLKPVSKRSKKDEDDEIDILG